MSLLYGLGARNQEVWGLRWASLAGEFAWVMEVLSSGQLEEWGKTEHSTKRRTAMPSLLQEDLGKWRAALRHAGHPARDVDFILPGDLGGTRHGIRDSQTGACHVSEGQAHSWGARFFTPAVEKAAQRPELFPILGATPYALRRGGISLRLRAEDPQTVASECGTSPRMLNDHYAYAIADLRRQGPRPADIEWRAARTEQMGRQSQDQQAMLAATPMTNAWASGASPSPHGSLLVGAALEHEACRSVSLVQCVKAPIVLYHLTDSEYSLGCRAETLFALSRNLDRLAPTLAALRTRCVVAA